MTIRILTVFGTRPEAIKMAPLVKVLQADPAFDCQVAVTAQHRQMLDQVLPIFDIKPDWDLNIMRPGQDLFDVTAQVIVGMREVLRETAPAMMLVHGDTTTCLSAALAGFYAGVPVGHVEAGLRTYNLQAPFPEELNRTLVGRIASQHFAPTPAAEANLMREGIAQKSIYVTGNTVIDALHWVTRQLEEWPESHWRNLLGHDLYGGLVDNRRKVILVTGHRRENFGTGFRNLCFGLAELAQRHPDWLIVYPVHLNPNVREPVYQFLGNAPNIHLIPPLEYAPFVWLMNRCDIILTDSGGIQEEAPALGKPVLVMRDVTERPEAVEANVARLVGTEPGVIIENVEEILGEVDIYRAMSLARNPYGDGRASTRIRDALKRMLSDETAIEPVTTADQAALS